jgi:hypothetical protein
MIRVGVSHATHIPRTGVIGSLQTVLATLFLLIATGCGPKIIEANNFEEYRQKHKSVAVLPFSVTIDPTKLPKDWTDKMVTEAQNDEGKSLQRQLYTRFKDRERKGEYSVEFQDIDKTTALLIKAGVNQQNLESFTKPELKEFLGVDAIISGSVYRSKPMSTGGAIVTGVLFGFWGSTNKVNVTLNIHDAATGDLVWTYEHKASGSVGSSPEDLSNSLMKSISKKFPYQLPDTSAQSDMARRR